MKIRNWLLLFLIGFSLIVTLSAIIFSVYEERQTLVNTSLVGGGFLLIAIFLSISMANRISHQIEQVIQGTQRISDGDYSRPLALTGPTEMGTLSTSINSMLESLKQRRQIEEALQISEERYRLLFEEMAEGFALHEIILDEAGKPADYRFIDVNPAFEKLTGLSRNELIGHRVMEVMPDTEYFWIESYGKVALTSEDLQFENYAQELDKWYEVRAFCPQPGQFAVTFSDITGRKLAEEELRNVAKFPDQNPNPVLRFTSGGKILFANSSSQPLLEYWDTLMDEVLPAEWQSRLKTIFENKTNQEIEIEINQVVYSCIFVPIPGDDCVNVYARDITSRVNAEQEIITLNKELEQRVKDRTMQLEASNKELEAFSYSVSHDLRSPLRGIDGWSQALVEDFGTQLEPKAREFLDRVRNEAQRMTRLIDDLLKLSRITRSDMKMTSVDLSTLAQNIAGELRETYADQNMQFEIQPGLTCCGDQRLLEIALSNLLGNARKFSSKEPVSRITFGSTKFDGEPVFFVNDNGVGFDMAYTQNLFGEFQRLHSQSEFPGTGIGLATVRRIIHRHGGIIWADARPDEGATFYFALPVKEKAVLNDK